MHGWRAVVGMACAVGSLEFRPIFLLFVRLVQMCQAEGFYPQRTQASVIEFVTAFFRRVKEQSRTAARLTCEGGSSAGTHPFVTEPSARWV